MVKFSHFSKTKGNSVNRLSEKKAIFSFFKSLKLFGNLAKRLLDKSKISRESARSKISEGNSLSSQDN